MAPKKFRFPSGQEIHVTPVTAIPSEWSPINLSQSEQDDLLRRINRAASNVERVPGRAVVTVSPTRRIRVTLNRPFASGLVTAAMVEQWDASVT